MALKTKAQLTTEIATFTDGGGAANTALKFRDFATDLLDSVGINILPIQDTQSTTNILTASNTDFSYTLNFWRSGNTIFVNGIIRNSTGNDSLSARDIATISTAWRPAVPGAPFLFQAFDESTPSKKMRINVTSTKLTLAVSMNDQNDHIVNFSYAAAN